MNMRRSIAAALVFLSLGCLSWADSRKKAIDLPSGNSPQLVDVIVQFDGKPSATARKLFKDLGIDLKKELDVLDTIVMALPGTLIELLSNDPSVLYISPNRIVKPRLDYATATVNAAGPDVTSSYTGEGVGIAIVDSGVSNHPDLLGRIVYSESFVGDGLPAIDLFGHGTHVAGIAAGNGASSTGKALLGLGPSYTKTFRGIAPKARIVNLKVLDGNGAGTVEAVLSAIARAIELRKTLNIKVLNLSLGHPVYESYKLDPLCQAVRKAWLAGITVVVSAGNDGRNNAFGSAGYGTINSPGNSPYAITVGAMKTMSTVSRNDDQIASYSSKGPTAIDHIVKPDLVAPGNRLISTRATATWFSSKFPDNGVPLSYYTASSYTTDSLSYFKLSGTSMAAPVVSGAAALLYDKTSNLTPDQIKVRLMKSASKAFPASSVAVDPATGQTFFSQYDIFTVGAGYLDVAAALKSTDSPKEPALSPEAQIDAKSGKPVVVIPKSVVWGDTSRYGLSVVWGDMAFVKDSSVVWGDSAVWGDRTTAGYSVVWGDTSPFASSVVWGDSSRLALSSLTGIFSPEALRIAVQGEP
jgi:serine protease AprX